MLLAFKIYEPRTTSYLPAAGKRTTSYPVFRRGRLRGELPARIRLRRWQANYELRVTSHELRVTRYELRVTRYELRTTSYDTRYPLSQLTEFADVLKITVLALPWAGGGDKITLLNFFDRCDHLFFQRR